MVSAGFCQPSAFTPATICGVLPTIASHLLKCLSDEAKSPSRTAVTASVLAGMSGAARAIQARIASGRHSATMRLTRHSVSFPTSEALR